LLTEIDGKAIPSNPSNLETAKDTPFNFVASIKSTLVAVKPATVTTSFEVIPTIDPDP